MPSTDENRTYYILEAEFLDDVTIDNVLDDFGAEDIKALIRAYVRRTNGI